MERNDGPSPGTLTLIGSGELSPSMGKVHRAIMARIDGPVQAVFVDTPAGFELNADQISANAVRYFQQHLGLDLAVASFKSIAASPAQLAHALRSLQDANYIIAGPGSPTYAARTWRGSEIATALAHRLARGAHLVLASAAAIAVGRHVLPVYEIYKVGEDPHWIDGLDLPGRYGLELAVVPHWNNREGSSHDTRYCFVGEPRMRLLEQLLPDTTTILGIDEHTACVLDPGGGGGTVMGAGHVTIRRKGHEDVRYAPGAAFSLDVLRGERAAGERPPAPAAGGEPAALAWMDWPAPREERQEVSPFIDVLVGARSRLREEEQWALADEIRQRLAELGVILEDGPDGTTWKRK